MRISSAFLLCAVLLASAANAQAEENYVQGYYRQDGVYVAPQYQPAANVNPHYDAGIQAMPSPFTAPNAQAPIPYAPQQALQAPSAPSPFGDGPFDYGN
jgi:hypothetical protein